MSTAHLSEFRRGFGDILPILLAAFPIGLLWGTLAGKAGLSPLETGLASATIFAGAAQFVAIDLWTNPAPWLLLTVTVFIVNLRHVLMGASLSRHVGEIPGRAMPLLMFLLVDEVWALAERRARNATLTWPYYLGMGLPLLANWVIATVAGAVMGRGLGDPAAYGLDFAFSALFIAILAGFWKGPRTAAVLAAAALTAAVVKLYVPGAWYIAAGGLAGVVAALLTASDEETAR
ncbi:MAG: AzlC family ABC transporter permease [Pseudomonadota bacterium]|nr:AzlC family ABC transporter permease [Pseudomonadota bacterium]